MSIGGFAVTVVAILKRSLRHIGSERVSASRRVFIAVAAVATLSGCETYLDDAASRLSKPDGIRPSSALQVAVNGPIEQSRLEREAVERRDAEGRPAPGLASGGGGPDVEPATIERGTGVFIQRALPTVDAESSEDLVTLNIVNTEIREAVERIIGDVLKSNYVIDEDVSGLITVQTSKPVRRSALFAVLEATLASRGFGVVLENGVYRVGKQESLGGNVAVGGAASVDPLSGRGVQVVPLRYVAAKEMAKILQPIAPEGAILNVDPTRNIIMLRGSSRELSHLLETVALFDVDWLQGRSFALYPVRTSDATAVAEEMTQIFDAQESGAGDGLVRFVPLDRLNAVLAISSQPRYVERAGYWIQRLDRVRGGLQRKVFVYDVQNRPAADLAAVLSDVFQRKPAAATKTDYDASVAPALDAAVAGADAEALVDGSTQGVLNGLGAADAPAPMRSGPEGLGLLDPARIEVHVDEASNALVVIATPADYALALEVIERLDRVPNQVLLEATIAEVTLTDDLEFGLQWFFGRGSSSGRNDFTFSTSETGAVASAFPGFSYLFSGSDIRVALNAVASLTNVKVLSAPSLMVLDNQQATLKVGDEVPIATSEARSVTDENAPIVNTISFRDTGVLLKITPRVNEGGLVILQIEQEVSDAQVTTTSGLTAPTISQRRIETTVAVQNGESLALGGLISESDGKRSVGVPFLSDLPVLGSAFRTTADEKQRTELLVIITPRVVRNIAEARAVTNEMREQLTTLRRSDKASAQARQVERNVEHEIDLRIEDSRPQP